MAVEREVVRRAPAVICPRCGEPGGFVVWGHPLCAGCAADWFTAPQYVIGAVGVGLGFEELCAEYQRRVGQFVKTKRS